MLNVKCAVRETKFGPIKSGWDLYRDDIFLQHFDSARDAEKTMEKMNIQEKIDSLQAQLDAANREIARLHLVIEESRKLTAE